MTKEEAIDRFKEARAGHKEFLSIETLDMAIKALEQESCSDAISRQKEDIAKAFQFGVALGFGKKHDEMGKVIDEIKKAITPEQKPCADCISRQAVDEVKELMTDMNGDMVYVVRMSDIRQLPSVNPQPKTGYWEQYGDPWEDKFKCSECGKKQPKILCGERIIGHWSDFCPNCGAKMKSEG